MIANPLKFLQSKLNELPCQDYPTESRIHTLRSFFTRSNKPCFVKREDELGFGISGGKFRKYRMLISYLLEQGYKEAVVIGGAFSNHILSITQLLIENGIKPTLFLKGQARACLQGNFLLTHMLLPESSIRWIPKQEWCDVQKIAQKYTQVHKKMIVIPEGATLFHTFLGALSLPLDIVRNEKQHDIVFDHLFLDVGTGYSAAALLLGFAFLEKTTMCHLLLLADTQEAFTLKLVKLHKEFEEWLGRTCPFPTHFRCCAPTLAPSFGSTSKALFDFIIETARAEGFFLDPIYSSKLFFQAKKLLKTDESIHGNTLLIHSGGALSLAGFQEVLAKVVIKE